MIELYDVVKEISNDRDEIKRLIFDCKSIKFKRIDDLLNKESVEHVNELISSIQSLSLTDFRTCLSESSNVIEVGWRLIIVFCVCIGYSRFGLCREIILSIADIINILSQSGAPIDLANGFNMQMAIGNIFEYNQTENVKWQNYNIKPTDIINIKRAEVFIDLMWNAMDKPPLFIMNGRKLLLKTDSLVGTGLYDYIVNHNQKTAEKDLLFLKKMGATDVFNKIMFLYSLTKSKLKKAAADESMAICNRLKEVLISYITFNYAKYLQDETNL